MAIKFNPLIFSGLDFTGGGSSSPTIGSPVIGADPSAVLITDESGNLADVPLYDGQIVIGSNSGAPIAAYITGTDNQIQVVPGPNSITLSLPQDITTISDVQFNSLLLTQPLTPQNGGTGVATTPTAGKLLIGNNAGTYTVASLTGTTNQVTVTGSSGGITLSLPQSIATTSSPTFANLSLSPSGAIDTTSVGTLAIGTANANIINIGNSGATVNIQGDTIYQNVTNLNVKDKNITINSGGSAGSASNSGIEIEEGGSITGYLRTSSDRAGMQFKAPATAGIATITPGASGFTIDQGSHNPVTLGTANGLSLSTQALSLALASTGTTGALSSTDFNTFNNKQPAGNYITALTGDASAAGPGSSAITFATVNTNVGSFGDASTSGTFTVNAKGLITAASSTSIQIAESQVTNLVSDLALKAPLASPTFTGTPLSTTAAPGTNTTQIATTAFVTAAIAATAITGDISPTTFNGLANNTANQTITGLTFATSISSFETFMNVQITATTPTYTSFKILGTRKGANWTGSDLQVEYTGDSITGLAFSITSAGQVQITVGNITGFSAAVMKFRAITL